MSPTVRSSPGSRVSRKPESLRLRARRGLGCPLSRTAGMPGRGAVGHARGASGRRAEPVRASHVGLRMAREPNKKANWSMRSFHSLWPRATLLRWLNSKPSTIRTAVCTAPRDSVGGSAGSVSGSHGIDSARGSRPPRASRETQSVVADGLEHRWRWGKVTATEARGPWLGTCTRSSAAGLVVRRTRGARGPA